MRRLSTIITVLLVLLAVCAGPAIAVEPDEILGDPVLEQRARKLSTGLRCLVCQNQSIDDSNAPLAKDLRVLVREKLVEGYSDQQILDHLVDRYGEFVLLKPRFGGQTMLLWLLPGIILGVGTIFVIRLFRRKYEPADSVSPLNKNEEAALTKILDERD